MMFPGMTVSYVVVDEEIAADFDKFAEVLDFPIRPEIPPPCWDERPIGIEACHAATKALCG